ncbi:MAG: Lrp/AsnC family transcriptional regulator [Candidatus Sericytochromatia bacterium]
MDDIDSKILNFLMSQGRASWAELATSLGLSAPAVAERVRKLEQRGVISGYAAEVRPEQLGLRLLAFVAVVLERPEHRAPFLAFVAASPLILECHHLAGEDDYLLKVLCHDTSELEDLLSEQLKSLPGLLRTRTTIALSSAKQTRRVPLPELSS